MGLFQQQKHKRFNYIPRRLRNSKDGEDLKSQWESVRGNGKQKSKKGFSGLFLMIVLGMVIAIWLILTHYEKS